MKKSEKKQPALSIIVPVYNVEPYLKDALDSILNQDFSDFEVIAINDGSTDQSGKLLDTYKEKDLRISVYHRENAGLSAARNFGFSKAVGDFIYFFDSDDLLEAGALTSLLLIIQNKNCDLVAFSGSCINEYCKPIKSDRPYLKQEVTDPVTGEELLFKMMSVNRYSPVVSMYLYKRKFLIKHNLLFREGFIHEDEAFTIQALCLAKKACSTDKIYYRHRLREDSIMAKVPGIINVRGWSAAVSEILAFKNQHHLQEQTLMLVLKRARQLGHNCVKTIISVNAGSTDKFKPEDFFTDYELNQLGITIRLRYKTPTLYKIFKRLNSIFSVQ